MLVFSWTCFAFGIPVVIDLGLVVYGVCDFVRYVGLAFVMVGICVCVL